MPSDEVLKKLADIIKTTERRDELLLELQKASIDGCDYTPDNFDEHQDLEHKEYNFDYNKYPLLALISKELGGTLSTSGRQIPIREFCNTIRDFMTNLKELTVETPKSLGNSEEKCAELYDFLTVYMSNTPHKPFVIKTKTCSEIVSGLTLSYEGKYVNLSLDKLISDKIHA